MRRAPSRELFADVGRAGVNVEDVAIDHDQNRQVGYLALRSSPGRGRADRADDRPGLERPALIPAACAATGSLTGCLTATPPPPLPYALGVTTPLVVAIDGPSGSGKSSTARGVAQKLGLAFLDTGAMYRAATWLVLHSEVAAERHRRRRGPGRVRGHRRRAGSRPTRPSPSTATT